MTWNDVLDYLKLCSKKQLEQPAIIGVDDGFIAASHFAIAAKCDLTNREDMSPMQLVLDTVVK